MNEQKELHLKDFEAFLIEHSIESTPQNIGPLECANQTFVAMEKCMLKAQKLEKLFWIEIMTNTVYTLNQYPTKALRSITLEET